MTNHPDEISRVSKVTSVASWSYVGHVVTTVPNKSPTACCQGHYSLVGCYVCPATPPVACCQGSGALFVGQPVVSVLPHRQLLATMGQGNWSRVGLARLLCCDAHCQGGQLASHGTFSGSSEVGSGAQHRPDVAEP
ncbi:hypothetical protein BHE74_00015147 [Ensete ventricosum]|nr:hypothetical protein GW17_00033098 [Ensete ventricosum]RWW76747.1 hypothetical protein BHE74_00015147 [Ensete ventricosum]